MSASTDRGGRSPAARWFCFIFLALIFCRVWGRITTEEVTSLVGMAPVRFLRTAVVATYGGSALLPAAGLKGRQHETDNHEHQCQKFI